MDAAKPSSLDFAAYRFQIDAEKIRHLLFRHDVGFVLEKLELVGFWHFGYVYDSSFCHLNATSFVCSMAREGPSVNTRPLLFCVLVWGSASLRYV